MELGRTHGEVQAMPYDEYIRWRAYMTWRNAERQHAANVAAMRANR